MIIGEPEKPAFLVERIPKWEVNGELYPKYLRATTFHSELPDIPGEHSAMMHPVRDAALYAKSDAELPLPEYEAVVAGVREFYHSLTPAI